MIKGKPRRPFAAKTKGRETMARLLQEITDWAECAAAAQWSVTTLARDCGVSVAQLERHFLETWRQTPRDKLQAERMRRACELLERRERIKDVADKLGYAHQCNFTTAFSRHFGYSSSDHVGTLSKARVESRKSEIGNRKSEIAWNLMRRCKRIRDEKSNIFVFGKLT